MRILVYVDSNCWDYLDDGSNQRHDGRCLQQMVNQLNAELIEDCPPGRVTYDADLVERPYFDGTAPLLAILMSRQPLDHVIIILGTNDMKARVNRNGNDITAGVMHRVDIVQSSGTDRGSWDAFLAPAAHVICPPALGGKTAYKCWLKHKKWIGGLEKSQMLASTLERTCHKREIDFIDKNEFIVSSPDHPVYWQANTHRQFGKAVAAQMKTSADVIGDPA